jgi:diaminohydroxyphosphoribosylaminopyrimidine deaminase/5-amino-6-(5-phosphoribosylamino)uracil reductase
MLVFKHPVRTKSMDDLRFMQMALDLAARGRGFTSPNPLVAAVVVKDGAVVGQGYHQFAGGPHAEVYAIDAAGGQARGATLYVNLEPCNHTGRTPPCTQKIVEAGIRRVVVGMQDPNPAVTGGGADFLKQRGIEVTLGVCEEAAEALNEVFIKYIRTRRPFVIAKCAATLDGRIATRTGDSKWVTGEAARACVHELRHAVDAILVGVGTVAADDPRLTTRIADREVKDPVRVILDTHGRIPLSARVLHHASGADTIVVTGPAAAADAHRRIAGQGVRVIEAATRDGRIDLPALMGELGGMGITSILIEGGSRVLASAFRAGVVDKACFFFAPLISGGDDGVPICSGPGPDRMRDCIRLVRIRTRHFGDDVMIEGYVAEAGSWKPEA